MRSKRAKGRKRRAKRCARPFWAMAFQRGVKWEGRWGSRRNGLGGNSENVKEAEAFSRTNAMQAIPSMPLGLCCWQHSPKCGLLLLPAVWQSTGRKAPNGAAQKETIRGPLNLSKLVNKITARKEATAGHRAAIFKSAKNGQESAKIG